MSKTHIVVGAGQTGGWAAVTMRREGFEGRIVLVGDEPHPPYERPPLSKTVLTTAEELPVQPFHANEVYERHGIELLLGSGGAAIDIPNHRFSLLDGTSLAFDQLLLATGGRARRLPVPGGELALAVRSHADALRLRAAFACSRRVVCVGAGVIGLECASSAHALGCDVTVLEPALRLMMRTLPEGAATKLRRVHERAGIAFRFDTGVTAIERAGSEYRVLCGDGTVLVCDCVVAGIGMERNTELAEAACIAVEGGILVDEFGRTGVPDIYAAGDVAAFWSPGRGRHLMLESWQHAQDHGVAVGRNMAGKEMPYTETPWFWSDQHGVNIQVAGTPTDGVGEVVRRGTGDAETSFYLDAVGHLVGAVGFDSARDVRGALSLIRQGTVLDPVLLSDPKVPPRQTVRSKAPASAAASKFAFSGRPSS